MYYVYFLKSQKDQSTYIGFTSDLKKRFYEHNKGKTKSTKSKLPYKLVYYEAYTSKTDARKRELELKNNSYKKEILFQQTLHSFAAIV